VPWLMYYMTSFICVSWINSTESPSEWQYYWVTTYIGIESFHSCENHGAHTGNTTASKSGVLSHDTHVKGVISHTNESRYTPWKHYSIVRQITVLWSHDTLHTHVHTHTHIHTHFATYDMKHVTRVWVMILKTPWTHTKNTTALISGILSRDTQIKRGMPQMNKSLHSPQKHQSFAKWMVVLMSHDTHMDWVMSHV